ncbi:MAG: mandelate racemase/muconate lactonizing enzyme family protein [Vicinamibacterales bacterium]
MPVQAPGRTLVPILVSTDAGIIGVGEAGLQRRWKAIDGAVDHLRRWLIGEDPMRIEHLWQRMFRGGFYPGDRLIGSVIAGIDIALWDIKGQTLGAPVYDLLGGHCRDHVQCFLAPTYRASLTASAKDPRDCFRAMTTTRDSFDSMVTLANECIAEGHHFFRIGPDAEGDQFNGRKAAARLAGQLKAVRNAVGDAIELMVDLHARLSPDEAIWFCREIEPLNLLLVEDPIRAEHAAGYRHIRAHTNVPLAAGEQWANKWEFRQAIEEELIDYARIDICIAGGLTEAKKIAAMAETHLIKILPHNPLGPICTAASLHLNLACDNAGPQEVVFPPATMLPDVFQCAFELDGTRLTVPTAPGIGVKFNRDAAKKYPPDMTEPPHFNREDGSYTNY